MLISLSIIFCLFSCSHSLNIAQSPVGSFFGRGHASEKTLLSQTTVDQIQHSPEISTAVEAIIPEQNRMQHQSAIPANTPSIPRLSITPATLKLALYYFLLYLCTVIYNVWRRAQLLPFPKKRKADLIEIAIRGLLR